MVMQQGTEFASTDERSLGAARRRLIAEGAAVSLIAFDPERGQYVFDRLDDHEM